MGRFARFASLALVSLCLALATALASPTLAHAAAGDLVGYAYIDLGGGVGDEKDAVILRNAQLPDGECEKMGYSPKGAVREGEDLSWLEAEGSADAFRVELEGPNENAETGSVRNWFKGWNGLRSADLSGLDTSNVTDMSSMFSGCSKLVSLDLSGWDTSAVVGMYGMFAACDSLSALSVGAGFAFRGALGNVPAGLWLSSADGGLYQLDELPQGLPATYVRISRFGSASFAVLSGGELVIRTSDFAGGEVPEGYLISDYGYGSAEDVPWYGRRDEIVKVVVEEGCAPLSCAHWFEGCSNLASVDLSGLGAARVESFASMFEGSGSLGNVDLSGLDVRRARNFASMFESCASLESVVAPKTYTRSAADFSSMFRGCSSLESLDLSNLNTKKATSMRRMLHGCRSLTSVTLGRNFSFFGAGNRRLPGSELPDGAWRLAGAAEAYTSDSVPNFAAGTWTRLTDEELAADDVPVVSVKAESEKGDPLLTVASEVAVEGGEPVEHLSYEVYEGYEGEVLTVGDEPVRASADMKTLNDKKAVIDKVAFRKKDGTVDHSIKVVKVGPRVTRVASGAFRGAPDVVTLAFPDVRNVKSVAGCASGSGLKYVRVKGTAVNKGLLASGGKKRELRVAFSGLRNGFGNKPGFKYYKDDKDLPRG